MSKNEKGESLKFLKPTADELAAARTILATADQKQKKSQMACMSAYLKLNSDVPGNKEASDTRGQTRQQYLEKYMVYQMRRKPGVATSTQLATTRTEATTDVYHWSKFQLEKEMGVTKATAWISSGKLDHHPDRLTGLDDEENREYEIKHSWTRKQSRDDDTLAIRAENTATDEDIANLKSTRLPVAASGSSGDAVKTELGAVVVKTEPGAEAEKLARLNAEQARSEVAKFMNEPQIVCRKLQDMNLTIQRMYSQAAAALYGKEFAEDLLKFQRKLKVMIGTTEKIVLGYQPDISQVPKLLKQIGMLEDQHEKFLSHGERLGIGIEPKSKKRRTTK